MCDLEVNSGQSMTRSEKMAVHVPESVPLDIRNGVPLDVRKGVPFDINIAKLPVPLIPLNVGTPFLSSVCSIL